MFVVGLVAPTTVKRPPTRSALFDGVFDCDVASVVLWLVVPVGVEEVEDAVVDAA